MNFLQRRRARFLVKRGLGDSDYEAFIRAMAVSGEGTSVLWRERPQVGAPTRLGG